MSTVSENRRRIINLDAEDSAIVIYPEGEIGVYYSSFHTENAKTTAAVVRKILSFLDIWASIEEETK